MLAALLAVVVLLLPPLVRATAPALRAPESPSAFRLNRAFDMPESKWRMVPAAAESLDGATPDVAIAAPAITCKLPDAELLPDHQTVKSPDPFRGPPSVEVS
jgi:hypothetical protein